MIVATDLQKIFAHHRAVDGISFQVHPGEVLGFLGPNGAGKTTTMRMLAGFVTPTAGKAEICGFAMDQHPVEAKRRLGYLPEGAPSYGEMTPLDFLKFIASVRGLTGSHCQHRTDIVVERLQLGPVLKQPIETLSKGFRRRVGLAQAMLHDPPVLILDEPTDGLDPNQKHEVRQLIQSMAPGKVIIISTHILEEVAAVCTRAIIITQGKIVADEKPAALVARSRYHQAVTLELEPGGDLQAVASVIRNLENVLVVEVDAPACRLTAFPRNGCNLLTEISQQASAQRWPLVQLHLETGRLEEVFRRITQPKSRAELVQ